MVEYTDQTGRKIILNKSPERIVSLVPSVTELLYDLGLDGRVVGITKFCVHPELWFRNITKVGGTKNPVLEKIRSLNPDLIIANKEENRKEDVDALAGDFPVWVSDVRNTTQALQMISDIGNLTQCHEKAAEITHSIRESLVPSSDWPARKTIYLIWWNPMMAVSSDTFIHDMMRCAGFENLTASSPDRYPILSESQIKDLDPDLILASSEPFPFKDEHLRILRDLVPRAQILPVDGEIFSWYGSRMLKAPAYFNWLRRELSASH